MTRTEKARAGFHNPYTCAQTIAAAFAHPTEDELAQLRTVSGGRAPGGRCGALWAAMSLLPEDSRAACEAHFAAEAGSADCRTLKRECRTSCQRCVEVAAEYLETQLPEPR